VTVSREPIGERGNFPVTSAKQGRKTMTPKYPPRNRIVRHIRIRAGDLVPHELNPRRHSSAQRAALEKLYEEIGFARSLLAYQLPDGRLKLIDGHLRADLAPDHEVDVEVLDVTDAEARALLLAIDPLAQLAGYDSEALDHLRTMVEKDSQAVKCLWEAILDSAQSTRKHLDDSGEKFPTDQFLILIECRDEAEQRELLQRFHKEGLRCEAKVG
jgi:hypothetical protein